MFATPIRSRLIFALILLALAPFAVIAKSTTAEGVAIIQGGEQASKDQVAKARLDAIADALRKIAMEHSSSITSRSLLGTKGELHENVLIQSQSPLKHLEIKDEHRLGGLYRVKLVALFNDQTRKNTNVEQCSSDMASLKREIRVDIVKDNLITSTPDNDIYGAMGEMKEALSQKLIGSTGFLLVRSTNNQAKRNTYRASHLVSKRDFNEYAITISAFETEDESIDYDAQEQVFTLGQTLSAITSAGKALIGLPFTVPKLLNPKPSDKKKRIALKLTLPGSYEIVKLLPKQSTNPVNNRAISKAFIKDWVDSNWPKIQMTLNCLPLAANTNKSVTGEMKISIGEKHGLTIGQQLLVLERSMQLKLQSPDSLQSKVGLYTVAAISKNNATIEPALGTLPVADNGYKIVIPF